MRKTPFIHRPLLWASKRLGQRERQIAVDLRARGYTQHEIAAYLGVNQGQISKLLREEAKPSTGQTSLFGA